MPLQNYTTSIGAMQTLAEIMAMLARHGARRIEAEYGPEVKYRQMARADAVKRILSQQKAGSRRPASIKADDEQAIRTAWRNVKDLLTTQMTMLEYEQVTAEELFLPTAVQRNGKTLFENYRERLMLADGQPEASEIPECFRRLGFSKMPKDSAEIEKKYRELARYAHPDAGGSDAAMKDLNHYYEQAKQAIKGSG